MKRKATTKAMSDAQFEGVKARYLKQISKMVVLREIPESLIINLDQTGIKLVPNGDWTMAQQGSRRIEVVGIGDKRQITATFAAAMDVHSYQCRFFTRGKPHVATLNMLFQMGLIFSILQTIGPMKKHAFGSLKKSYFHTSAK